MTKMDKIIALKTLGEVRYTTPIQFLAQSDSNWVKAYLVISTKYVLMLKSKEKYESWKDELSAHCDEINLFRLSRFKTHKFYQKSCILKGHMEIMSDYVETDKLKRLGLRVSTEEFQKLWGVLHDAIEACPGLPEPLTVAGDHKVVQSWVSNKTADTVVLQGLLEKQSRARLWQKRWFVLTPIVLKYWKSEDEAKATENNDEDVVVIPLCNLRWVSLDDKRSNEIVIAMDKGGIHVVHRDLYRIRAENKDQALKWMTKLHEMINDNNLAYQKSVERAVLQQGNNVLQTAQRVSQSSGNSLGDFRFTNIDPSTNDDIRVVFVGTCQRVPLNQLFQEAERGVRIPVRSKESDTQPKFEIFAKMKFDALDKAPWQLLTSRNPMAWVAGCCLPAALMGLYWLLAMVLVGTGYWVTKRNHRLYDLSLSLFRRPPEGHGVVMNPPAPTQTDPIKGFGQLKRNLKDLYENDEEGILTDFYLYKFFKGVGLEVLKAEEAIRSNFAWRRDYRPDVLVKQYVPPKLVQDYWYRCPLKLQQDKELNHMCFMRVGLTDIKGLYAALGSEEFTKAMVWWLETMSIKMYQNHIENMVETGTPEIDPDGTYNFDKFGFVTMITDLENFGSGQILGSEIGNLISQHFNHYPEMMTVGVLVNVPWIFKSCWSIISVFLEESTRNKVKMAGAGEATTKILLEIAEADQIPKYLGGTMEVDGDPECKELICKPKLRHIPKSKHKF